jgi:cell wall-associated NlpC family hydrolase
VPSLPGRGNPLLVLAFAVVALALAAPHVAANPPGSDLDRQIDSTSQRLEVLIERHNALRSDVQATRTRIGLVSARLAELTATVAVAQARVDLVAAWAYKTGPTTSVMSVLGAGTPADFLARLTALDGAARADRRQLDALATLRGQLAAERDDLRALAEAQATQETQLAGDRARIERDLAALLALKRQIGATSRSGDRTAAPVVTAPPAPPPPPAIAPPAPPAPAVAPPTRAASSAANRVVAFAYAQVGKWYAWGADGPNTYDCSGLALASWRAGGVSLPHNAARQYAVVRHVSRADLRPGDLVFYYGDIHHVAVYVGGGSVVHAPNSGERVRVQRMDMAPIHGFGRPA